MSGAPDYHLIPTGKVETIDPGAPKDFASMTKSLGKDIDRGDVTAKGGYDNAWIFDTGGTSLGSHLHSQVSDPPAPLSVVLTARATWLLPNLWQARRGSLAGR